MRNLLKVLLVSLLALSLGSCSAFKSSVYDAAMAAAEKRAGVEVKVAVAGDNQIAYYEGGNPEGEVVVLFHGFSSSKSAWLSIIPRLTDKYRVIAPDMPAHGESTYDPDTSYSLLDQIQTMAVFFDTLDIQKFHLAGHSMGGAIAVLYTAENPHQVATLWLVNSGGVLSPEPSEWFKGMEKGQNALIVRSREQFDQMMALAREDTPNIPWPVSAEMADRHIARADQYEKVFNDIMQLEETEDLVPYLCKIKAPVLIIWGRQDKLLHVSSVQVFEEHLENSHSVILEGVGHMPIVEKPKISAEYYRDFLSEKAATGSQTP